MIDIVTDIFPLQDVKVEFRIPSTEPTPDNVDNMKTPKGKMTVELVPEREAIPFEKKGDVISFVVPRIEGHQMVSVSVR